MKQPACQKTGVDGRVSMNRITQRVSSGGVDGVSMQICIDTHLKPRGYWVKRPRVSMVSMDPTPSGFRADHLTRVRGRKTGRIDTICLIPQSPRGFKWVSMGVSMGVDALRVLETQGVVRFIDTTPSTPVFWHGLCRTAATA